MPGVLLLICVTEHDLGVRNAPAKGKRAAVGSENTPKCRGGKADLLYRREILRGGLRFGLGLVTLTQGLGAVFGCFVLVLML